MVDPEPGRCRRTDGKKWRCSKNVIPDQKYCEQHMHRGRQRSRKPVESSQITLPNRKPSKNSNNLSAPVSFRHMNQSSCNSSPSQEVTSTTAVDSSNVHSKRNIISTNATVSTTIDTKENDCKRSKNLPNASDGGEEKLSISDHNIIQRSSKSGTAIGNSPSPGVDFSPKSVLQVLGCKSSRVCKTEIELEPGRCRRTDGKKWRCSRDVVPDQKYCARHMHRGAKKHVEASQPVPISTVVDCPTTRLKMAKKAACTAVTTSLSVSIPSHQPSTREERSMSSSSETTISDSTIF